MTWDRRVELALELLISHGKKATQECGTQAIISMKLGLARRELRVVDYHLLT